MARLRPRSRPPVPPMRSGFCRPYWAAASPRPPHELDGYEPLAAPLLRPPSVDRAVRPAFARHCHCSGDGARRAALLVLGELTEPRSATGAAANPRGGTAFRGSEGWARSV